MAGWKLRKDKTAAETPGDDPLAAAPAEEPLAEQARGEPAATVSAPELPDFDSDTDLHFTDTDFDSSNGSLKTDDGPLTLVDYSGPGTETHPPESHAKELHAEELHAAEIYPQESHSGAAETPPPASDDFLERLRTSPEVPAGPAPSGFGMPFSPSIPSVAPFVLDTPSPAPPPEPTPQLIVHFGRLSAAFPLTKETTTIGRPDSALHHYPDVEIDMDDAVSRRHAEVVRQADGFYLVDTGSTNGTMLNGEVLPPHQERLLAHGDRIRVGDRTEIIFE